MRFGGHFAKSAQDEKSVFRRRSIAREFANEDDESMQRFARERGRNATARDELDQQWLTALRIGAAAERTHSKARRVRQDLHPKTYSCTSSGAMDAEIARKGMGSTVAPNRSAANTKPKSTTPPCAHLTSPALSASPNAPSPAATAPPPSAQAHNSHPQAASAAHPHSQKSPSSPQAA